MVLLLQKHNCGMWQCWDRASSIKMQRRGSEKSHLSNLTIIWWDFKFGRQLIRCTVVRKVTSFWGSHAFSFLYSKFPLNIPQVLSSVQSLSHVWLFAIPWTVACQASLSITNSQGLLKLKSIESVMPSKHLVLWHPLLLLPSIFPSIRVFPNESVLHIRWPKYWSFSFGISPSNEYSGLIPLRMAWFSAPRNPFRFSLLSSSFLILGKT